MGTLEKEAKRIRRLGYVQKALLATVAVAGAVALVMIVPNIFQALPRITGNKYKFASRARTALGKLVEMGYVRFVEKKGKKYIEITDVGRRTLALEKEHIALKIGTRRRWDKRWRMVIFDIPEQYRTTRVRLRRTMKELGFLRLQDSVWVFPYDCEDFIALLKAELHTGKYVLYTIVEKIENDQPIKEHFGLK
ncbi:hypothetical protein HY417_01570 [Candidatus Kaiserbacteria bacterium]|nr:hypothetical protein [Candidatus Kaiserbacteria bacterium]